MVLLPRNLWGLEIEMALVVPAAEIFIHLEVAADLDDLRTPLARCGSLHHKLWGVAEGTLACRLYELSAGFYGL